MQPLRGHCNLRPKAKLTTVSEACAGVDIDCSRVDFLDETICVILVLGQDPIRTTRAVLVNVADRFIETRDNFEAEAPVTAIRYQNLQVPQARRVHLLQELKLPFPLLEMQPRLDQGFRRHMVKIRLRSLRERAAYPKRYRRLVAAS